MEAKIGGYRGRGPGSRVPPRGVKIGGLASPPARLPFLAAMYAILAGDISNNTPVEYNNSGMHYGTPFAI